MRLSHGRFSQFALLTVPVSVIFFACGCGGPARGPAVPAELQDRAVVEGFSPAIRSWGATPNPEFLEELHQSIDREKAHRAASGLSGPLPPAEFLAISGGGSNGAFTAGLLNGWTAAGNRPTFKAVTGISTGALLAPFAFLGSDYDDSVRKFYTEITADDILIERGGLAAITDDALSDNAPLRDMLEEIIDAKLVDAIAAEHAKGRVLAIGTANLDAQRGVIWNIGAIAATNHPRRIELIRNIMTASSAIPAVFPPMMFDVVADARPYQELHGDGGTITQVFLYPPSMKLKAEAEARGAFRERRAYIIRNARFAPEWAETPRKTLSIAGRAVSSLIATQGVGDLYRSYLNAERDGVDYNLACIPADFTETEKVPFDQQYMRKLYDVGYRLAKNGYPWQKFPPNFEPGSAR